MMSVLLIVVALSHAISAVPYAHREVNRDMELLERLLELEDSPDNLESRGVDGETELNVVGKDVRQSSTKFHYTAASKAVDGQYDNSLMIGAGGSCAMTDGEENPWWTLDLGDTHCISRVSILNVQGGFGMYLKDAVVTAGMGPVRANHQCGSPISSDQASKASTIIYFNCDPPIEADTLFVRAHNAMLPLCEVRVYEVPGDQCNQGLIGEKELTMTGKMVSQSSRPQNYDTESMATKVVDGRYDDANLLDKNGNIEGGSCTIGRRPEKNPHWFALLGGDHCISKVSILNRGDGHSERLTGATVRVGPALSPELDVNTQCGVPVTAEQAEVAGGTVQFKCSQPVLASFLLVVTPSKEAYLQLCEVRVWEVPLEQCLPGPDEQKELNVVGKDVRQSSDAYEYTVASKAVDGQYDNPMITNSGGEIDGSCSVAGEGEKPWWTLDLGDTHCISRVSILIPRGGGGIYLRDAVVTAGMGLPGANHQCGSPVSIGRARKGGTVYFNCNPPIEADTLLVKSPHTGMLPLCEVRVYEVPGDQCNQGNELQTELNIVKSEAVDQTSDMNGFDATKAVDGRYDDGKMVKDVDIDGGTCSMTGFQEDPAWGLTLDEDYCISRVSILNRADGHSERLTGATVTAVSSKNTKVPQQCGSPVTAEQASVPGATIFIDCYSSPILVNTLTIKIDSSNASLQMCEVRLWQVPLDQCPTDINECDSSPCKNGICHDEVDGFSCECPLGYEGTLCETDIDGCEGSPCKNGICHDEVNGFTCECPLGFEGSLCETDIDGCEGSPCKNGICHDEVNGFTCECPLGYKGTLCETDIDGCEGSPCKNGASCHDEVNGFTCECSPGFEGSLCETDIDECDVSPCNNGASCHDEVNGFSCECPLGYEGTLCETDIDECEDNPCKNGICHDEVNGFSCECPLGYEGTLCETDIDGCEGSPCKNGICHDEVNGFTCECPLGFEGSLCETDIDGCEGSPCKNGICHDEVNGFTCECPLGYKGTLCETDIDGCEGSPCKNGASCHDEVNGFTCECSPGFEGSLCETDIDECDVSPCNNGASCHDEVNGFSCECPLGYEGTLCETDIDECEDNPCKNGICHDEVNGFSCECPLGYEGTLCETDIDECEDNPCKNGICHDEVNGFSCECPLGYEGTLCETDIDGCEGSPCKNGICHDEVNGFTCECPLGYEGTLCETDIDGCEGSPCKNGICHDEVNGFTCECPLGYEGTLCETDIDGCEGSPCKNGICHDEVNGFTCECPLGYEGTLCETDIDGCEGSPCKNGICHDEVNGFSCECPLGYEGTLCETDTDDCKTDSCKNEGVCIDEVNGFSCECFHGFEGDSCETNIDECGSEPCRNGAECVDGINEVSCVCAAGFSGILCEIEIRPCDSSPCQNGVCIKDVDSYTCECSPGYEGANCEFNIDECESGPCLNDAECVDGEDEVKCTCAAGFTGPLCETALAAPIEPIIACESSPCINGVCHDEVNGFRCVCALGYEGTLCETALIATHGCTANPCKNGVCINYGTIAFQCVCSPGFTGTLCEIGESQGPQLNHPLQPPPQHPPSIDGEIETVTDYLYVNLVTVYCVRKVVVHKRGDCTGDRLTGTVVRAGASSTGINNAICGSALTAQQALVRRSTVDFVCDPPLTAKYVTVDIPLLGVGQKQTCEVTIEQGSPEQCFI